MYKISKLKSVVWPSPGKPALLLAFIVTVVLLSACASRAPAPTSADGFIVERAQGRWDALLAGDYETAYAFYSPGYRSTTSLEDFRFETQSRRVRWSSAQYKEYNCQETACTVIFDMGYAVIKPVPGLDKYDGSDVVEEKWVKTDGQWWFLPKK